MIGHITLPELHRLLASVEISNGLANRCLWIFADNLLSPEAAIMIESLKNGPLTMSQVHGLFKRNATKAEIETAIAEISARIVIEGGGVGGGKSIRLK